MKQTQALQVDFKDKDGWHDDVAYCVLMLSSVISKSGQKRLPEPLKAKKIISI